MTDSQPPRESAYREMCRRMAETAATWADCSDAREALKVFRELGRDCQALLDGDGIDEPPPAPTAFALYDHDLCELASRQVYWDHAEAVAEADRMNNVIVIQLPIELNAGQSDPADEESQLCDCQSPGRFYSGVPGILACVVNGRLVTGAQVERCDGCQRYEPDDAALARLIDLGIAPGD
jgi:hypothetical protein